MEYRWLISEETQERLDWWSSLSDAEREAELEESARTKRWDKRSQENAAGKSVPNSSSAQLSGS